MSLEVVKSMCTLVATGGDSTSGLFAQIEQVGRAPASKVLRSCTLRDFSACTPVFFAMRERARAQAKREQ